MFFSFAFWSCNKKDLEAEIPAYITINNFSFTTNYSTQGTNSHYFSDAWVYLDDELLGIYELPVTFPVLKTGTAKIQVYPGIKENGISERRSRYLFTKPHEESITLEANKTTEVNPASSYFSSVNFSWKEDFETASLPFTYAATSDTTMFKTNTDVFEGNYSGKVFLTSNMDFYECSTPKLTGLPAFGNSIFMELNFKTNQPVLVGMYADSYQIGLFYLNTSDDWKKIYLNLTEGFQSNPNASEYKIFFGFQSKVTNPEFLIDNIKILHF